MPSSLRKRSIFEMRGLDLSWDRDVFDFCGGKKRVLLESPPVAWHEYHGEVSERLKEHAWKACIRESVSWVRIPPSPIFPFSKIIKNFYNARYEMSFLPSPRA